MITQDLGIATAYGYAKSKGYTGTEAEFAELMASYASTAQTAIEAADRAVEANTAAQSAKTSAQSSASTASTAAQTATSKASEAVTAADTATTKASEASQSASTASAAATSAGTSAQTATTAAATATAKASEASESAATASTAKTDAESARDAAAQSASEAAASAESIDPETLEHKAYGAYVVESASGAVASFADGADSIPMKDVLVHIEPVQEGSGDPSPDNVRPITGWTAAKVTRTGKNLLPNVFTGATTNGITFTVRSDGTVMASGTATAVATRSAVVRLKAGTYILSGSPSGASDSTYEIQAEVGGLYERDFGSGVQFDITEDCDARIFLVVRNGQTVENLVYKPMLRLASDTDETYEPYSEQTYDITFPSEAGTVYGGTLDVTTGELVVDTKYKNVALNNFTYNLTINCLIEYAVHNTLADAKAPSNNNVKFNAIADAIRINSARAVNSGADGFGITASKDIYLRSFGLTSLAEYQNAFSQGINVVYKLATPITYQLTPQEITSLLGANNLWADTGNSEVEYRADAKLYITKKITEAVSALS